MKRSVDAAKALGLDYFVPDFYVVSEGRQEASQLHMAGCSLAFGL